MILWIVIPLGVVVLAVGGSVLWSWRRPELGIVDGRLRPCGDSPNCVCSEEGDQLHGIEPLPAGKGGDPIERVKQVMSEFPGATLIDETDGYLRYECATPLVHYVDDVEFLLDREAGVVQVRSASRVGRSDLGTNRRRIEEIRRRYESSADP